MWRHKHLIRCEYQTRRAIGRNLFLKRICKSFSVISIWFWLTIHWMKQAFNGANEGWEGDFVARHEKIGQIVSQELSLCHYVCFYMCDHYVFVGQENAVSAHWKFILDLLMDLDGSKANWVREVHAVLHRQNGSIAAIIKIVTAGQSCLPSFRRGIEFGCWKWRHFAFISSTLHPSYASIGCVRFLHTIGNFYGFVLCASRVHRQKLSSCYRCRSQLRRITAL